MRALVTGHKGFVGGEIYRALKNGWLPGYEHVVGFDVKDGSWADCRMVFQVDEHYDIIFHCAAVVGGRLTISEDPMAVAVDLALDSDLFRWAARGNADRVVYFSSSAAYPIDVQDERQLRLPERLIDVHGDWLGRPDLTYGWAKLTGEMLATYARRQGVKVHVLRPFSGYGETQEPSYPLPAFVERAKRRDDPFDIWGDGQQTRDFVHIHDILTVLRRVIETDSEEPINVGTGRATSFNDLARIVTAAAGYEPKFRHLRSKPTGPQWRVADVSNLTALFGRDIVGEFLTVEEGVARMLSA